MSALSKGKIYLERTATCWTADMERTPEADQIHDLFGTWILPLPYTVQASARMVLAETVARFPEYSVIIVD